ncbi:peroxin 19 [Trypanosoma grayi]|uniref:peroxin 19 n=1 Tax=Trypanosoma grayi TaxID=71804 RepID=UPI0004F4B762|nr:peroxin 19 [Trypanosoma grayi]KEG07881.1 peroxin 19 [Trypanosoma grayi]
MTHPTDDDDLDALLDDCINTMDEQERRHEEEIKARDAVREEELEKALASSDEGSVAQILQSLIGNGADNATTDPEALLDKLKAEITNMASMVDDLPDLSEEERTSLAQVRQMLDSLQGNGEAPPPLSAEGGAAGEGDEAFDSVMKKCIADMERLAGNREGGTAPTANASETSGLGTASAGGASADPMAGLTGMVLDFLIDPQLLEPLKVMRESYPCWLAQHESSTSAEDLERYRKQHDLTIKICDLLGEGPIDRNDEEKVNQIVTLMHELSVLVPLPPGLSDVDVKSSK